jgi:hypothetical protein
MFSRASNRLGSRPLVGAVKYDDAPGVTAVIVPGKEARAVENGEAVRRELMSTGPSSRRTASMSG